MSSDSNKIKNKKQFLKPKSTLKALLLLILFHWPVSEVDGTERSWLLPNSSYPLHYNLQLQTQVHREIYEYTGNCTIELEVRENTEEIVLHAANLSISDISIRQHETGLLFDCVKYELDPTHQLLVIKRAANCAQPWIFERYQHLSVTILYSALIGDNIVGFNKFKHAVSSDNVDIVFGAATLFEPVSARTAFPCYDEPMYKTNFTLSVTHGANYSVYSNMPIKRQEQHVEDANMTTTYFMTTPPLASYLVAIIITQPYHIVSQKSNGIVHRVLLPPSVNDNDALEGLTTVQNSIAAIKLMSDYFGQPYVLPKLDHFGVPGYYTDGMENWGLITYKPKYLNLSANISDIDKSKRLISQNHELLHQWFGNLVTPLTWDDIWLSEAFATYYSFIFTDILYPELNATQILDGTCFNSYSRSIEFAIVSSVEKPSDLLNYFRMVMYDRAPCVLQMFVHAFGPAIWQKALRNYISENKYRNTDTNKLIEALQSAIQDEYAAMNQTWPYDLATILTPWLKQEDYPMVTVHRDYHTNRLHITQHSFDADSSQLWWLPLTFETPATNRSQTANRYKAELFMPATNELVYELPHTYDFKSEDWYLLNGDGKSFYTVNYDVGNWRRIINALQREPRDFSFNTRTTLIRNIWQACKMQTLEDPLLLLQMFKCLRSEPDILVILKTITAEAYNTIFEVSDFEALYIKFLDDIGVKEDIEMLDRPDDSNFDELFTNCKTSNVSNEIYDCWYNLMLTRNEEHFERMLEEVYRIEHSSKPQCETKLEFLCLFLTEPLTANHNVTWSKLATEFETVLEKAPCEISVWSKNILDSAELIDPRYLEQVLHAVDLYDRKVVQPSGKTLRNELLKKRAKDKMSRVTGGLQHWFFEHVNKTELYNFFHNAFP